jgi:hypothetical protein
MAVPKGGHKDGASSDIKIIKLALDYAITSLSRARVCGPIGYTAAVSPALWTLRQRTGRRLQDASLTGWSRLTGITRIAQTRVASETSEPGRILRASYARQRFLVALGNITCIAAAAAPPWVRMWRAHQRHAPLARVNKSPIASTAPVVSKPG